jgi:peroxiredoxin
VIGIGDVAPEFELMDVDGDVQSFQTPAVVIFTCNHCPYALAWHDRLMDVARDYPDVHFYAINPNDAERYPRDSFEAMKERVRRDDGWPMPYLRDESQEVARAYGAKTTPDVFLVDSPGALRYRGAPDPDHQDPSLNASWLRAALDSVLAGEEVARPETEPVGCSVKWK